MGHLYDTREKAIRHKVEKDDTLAKIAAKYKGKDDVPVDLDWREIALYNWATDVKDEVTLALCERAGSSDPDPYSSGAEPDGLALDPKFGPNNPQPILVPKLWKAKSLDVNKKYTVEARSHTPAPSVNITKLDKWFIPAYETCDVNYRALASNGFQGAVKFEVFASNYGKLKDWNNGLPTFEPLPDVPVYSSEADGGTVPEWRGLSKCGQGALSPDNHPLNAAFSPYTAVFRYARQDAHKDARIDLEPFWVLFDNADKPSPASCKIQWKLHKADPLKIGLLQIAAGDGTFVFARGLSSSELASGTFQWNGEHSDGATATPDNMPYRVHIAAHTDIDTDDALAIAAMQTEVRLYVHKETYLPNKANYDPLTDKISLDFSIADVYHKDDPPPAGNSLWTKFKLAEAGFHPGPVTDAAENKHFETARNEFQRSAPKWLRNGNAPFERMDIGGDNAETKDALEHLDPLRKRPWFGKPADPGDVIGFGWRPGNWTDVTGGDFLTRLRDPAKRMIVWVDDRNWYTDGKYWHKGFYNNVVTVPQAVLDAIHNDEANLGGNTGAGRGSYEDRDNRVTYDARDIARPWIPLQVDLRLLSKTQDLNSEVGTPDPALAETMRKAIGPLRVDWSFDEIEKTSAVQNVTENHAPVTQLLPELDIEPEALFSRLYHPPAVRLRFPRPQGTRTRMALRWTLDQLKDEHDRKDVNRKSLYFNAPERYGGIRPDHAPDRYFKAPFGQDGDSLVPWTAKPFDARQTVCTAVHDPVGQNDVFNKRIGRAGVYFHPSRMAGDGYQIRAQVRFDDSGPFVSPNAKVHALRYARLPQAQSVQFRLWRKTSIRGYVSWAYDDNWSAPGPSCFPNFPATGPHEWRAQYTACHVSIENELNVPDGQVVQDVNTLFPNLNDYRDLVLRTLDPNGTRCYTAQRNAITLSDDYFWPWSAHQNYGRTVASTNPDFGAAKQEVSTEMLCDLVALAIRFSLAIVKAIESQTGRMRGHVLVQFQTTPNAHYRQYRCNTHGHLALYIQNTAAPQNHACPIPGCHGALAPIPAYAGRYVCGNSHLGSFWESTPWGGGFTGQLCWCGSQIAMYQIDVLDGGLESYRYQRGSKWVDGANAPSCGFPIGAFWNITGDATLWAHEIGHNRHYEHSADAQQDPNNPARGEHDNADNPAFPPPPVLPGQGAPPPDRNAGWDRACLMSYVTHQPNYDPDRDMPCFCYKCALKNRGWRLAGLPMPAGDLQDVSGTGV